MPLLVSPIPRRLVLRDSMSINGTVTRANGNRTTTLGVKGFNDDFYKDVVDALVSECNYTRSAAPMPSGWRSVLTDGSVFTPPGTNLTEQDATCIMDARNHGAQVYNAGLIPSAPSPSSAAQTAAKKSLLTDLRVVTVLCSLVAVSLTVAVVSLCCWHFDLHPLRAAKRFIRNAQDSFNARKGEP